MGVFGSLEQVAGIEPPTAFCFGSFDGVHLGHKRLLLALAQTGLTTCILSFTNHPREVLRPEKAVARISRNYQKARWLQEAGVNNLILIPFTSELAAHSPRHFLEKIRGKVPFSQLILGYDSVFGKDRQGTPEHVGLLAREMDFTVEYVSAHEEDGTIVSSSQIRRLVREGNLDTVKRYLGRPYSLAGVVRPGKQLGKALGFPTANVDIQGLCLPPSSVYAVTVRRSGTWHRGVANLGRAPTIQQDGPLVLEVHLIDFPEPTSLYGEELEVYLIDHIRPEKQFSSAADLKEQINEDLTRAKRILKDKISG